MNDPQNDRRTLACHELEMARERTAATERLARADQHVTHRPNGVVTGWGAAFDEWRDARESVDALAAFAPRNWWDTPPAEPASGQS